MSPNRTRVKEAIENGHSPSPGASSGVLGLLIWWGAFLAKITPSALRDLATKHGLDLGLLPPAPNAAQAFKRAAHSVESQSEGIRIELVFRDPMEITYGLLRRSTDKGSRRAKWTQFARVSWFPKSRGQQFLSDNPNDPTVQAIVDAIPHFHDHYVTDDIARLNLNVMKRCNAIPMTITRTNSRFVPAPSSATALALAEVLAEVPGADIAVITVPDDPISRGTMVHATRSRLSSKVEEAETELERIKIALDAAAEGKGNGPRDSTLQSRVEDYKQLSAKIEMFGDLLRFKAEDLEKRLADVRASLLGLLGFDE